MPHRRGRQGGGRARGERRLRAEPGAHRHAADGDDVRDPGGEAPEILASIQQHAGADNAVAKYAADDARRFA